MHIPLEGLKIKSTWMPNFLEPQQELNMQETNSPSPERSFGVCETSWVAEHKHNLSFRRTLSPLPEPQCKSDFGFRRSLSPETQCDFGTQPPLKKNFSFRTKPPPSQVPKIKKDFGFCRALSPSPPWKHKSDFGFREPLSLEPRLPETQGDFGTQEPLKKDFGFRRMLSHSPPPEDKSGVGVGEPLFLPDSEDDFQAQPPFSPEQLAKASEPFRHSPRTPPGREFHIASSYVRPTQLLWSKQVGYGEPNHHLPEEVSLAQLEKLSACVYRFVEPFTR
jgi:hypothetical protein